MKHFVKDIHGLTKAFTEVKGERFEFVGSKSDPKPADQFVSDNPAEVIHQTNNPGAKPLPDGDMPEGEKSFIDEQDDLPF